MKNSLGAVRPTQKPFELKSWVGPCWFCLEETVTKSIIICCSLPSNVVATWCHLPSLKLPLGMLPPRADPHQ